MVHPKFWMCYRYKTNRMKINNLLCILLAGSLSACVASSKTETKAEKQGWKLSMQSYTFHLFSVVESLEKTCELGLHYIEIYPGQKMGEGFDDAVFGYALTAEQQEQLKELAASKDVKIVSSGVWTSSRDEWEKVFSFAKNMGMEFISAEPAREDWSTIEALAKQYGIKVATHNHPNENSYWKPEILLEHIGNLDALLGSCADVGHFKRMGIDPIPALRQLEGRLIAMHFKDIAPKEPEEVLEDVVWGNGVLNVKGMLEELKRQEFSGYFTIEYEANWENNLPEIRQSIDYFNEVAQEIL
ncbi:MAG: sugar phosphate isomerase/epimerase [Parabacteroides sp.]|nr:sugar phosphate isomerase/epimerase [Parabacteroides sp.]